MKIKHEKLTPTLPDGHKWRKDYVLCVHPGTHRHHRLRPTLAHADFCHLGQIHHSSDFPCFHIDTKHHTTVCGCGIQKLNPI